MENDKQKLSCKKITEEIDQYLQQVSSILSLYVNVCVTGNIAVDVQQHDRLYKLTQIATQFTSDQLSKLNEMQKVFGYKDENLNQFKLMIYDWNMTKQLNIM